MSAWVVEEEHIRVLVWAGLRISSDRLQWWYRRKWRYLDLREAARVGTMLMRTNVASVNYRYDENTSVPYHHRSPKHTTWSVGELLKALGCYEYQSCEHKGWNGSEAKKFCDALRIQLTHHVEGYEDGPWGIDSDSVPLAEKVLV